jgi:peptidoglycan/LPS O-acetylase OafA/YrhL
MKFMYCANSYLESVKYWLREVIVRATNDDKTELRRIDYLDGWRGLAIGFVLVGHFLPTDIIVEMNLNLGRLGVDVFFVLSGLLMSNLLFIKRTKITTFYKRRISRVFPVYFVFLSLICGVSYLLELSSEHENYFYNLFFLRTYYPVSPDLWNTGIPIGHLWSLTVEEHCYILLSIIAVIRVLIGKEYFLLIVLGSSSILLHYLYIKFSDSAPENFFLKTEINASHVLLSAGYFLIKKNFEHLVPPWLPIITFFLSIFCYTNYAPWYSSWLISPFLLAFTVNHLDLTPGFIKSFLSIEPIRLLGVWSFSIYIWQQPFFIYLRHGEEFPYNNVLLLFISILIGALSFYYFENPSRKYLNKKW